MRGYKQPAHCACGVPHASDHSSPAHRQSYDASQTLLFSASVGMRLSTREKVFCQTVPEGVPDFAEEVTGEPQPWLWKKLTRFGSTVSRSPACLDGGPLRCGCPHAWPAEREGKILALFRVPSWMGSPSGCAVADSPGLACRTPYCQ